MKIMITKPNKSLRYETHSLLIKVLRFFLIPILNSLPESIGRWFFISFGRDTVEVHKNAKSYLALECLYTRYNRPFFNGDVDVLDDLADLFWNSFLSNAKAVRNRLKLVKQELKKAILILAKKKKDIYLFSLGSGSARAVLEVLSELKDKPFTIHVKLLDLSRNALTYSRSLAESLGVGAHIEYIRGSIQNLEKYCNGFKPDIVEMVGLLDYLDREQAIDTVNKIYNTLSPNGTLVTSNILNNKERPFVTGAIGWPMIYRTPDAIAEIIRQGGFDSDQYRIICEPLKIQALAICKKFV